MGSKNIARGDIRLARGWRESVAKLFLFFVTDSEKKLLVGRVENFGGLMRENFREWRADGKSTETKKM